MNEKLLAFANKDNVEQKNMDGKVNDNEESYKWLTSWASKHKVELDDRNKVDSNGIRYVYVNCPNDAGHKDAAISVNPRIFQIPYIVNLPTLNRWNRKLANGSNNQLIH